MISSPPSLQLSWRIFQRSATRAAGRWLRRFGLWLAALAPAVGLGYLIWKHQVNFPFLDDWMFTSMYEKVFSGQLEWRDFFVVQMEHRLATVRAILVALLWLAPGQWTVQNWLALAFLGVISGNLFCLLRRHRASFPPWVGVYVLINITLFSPILYQIVLWPMMFQVVIPLAALTGALAAIDSRWPLALRWLVAVGAAVTGTLSFASALLIWPLVAMAIWISDAVGSRRQRIAFLILWLAAAAVTLGLYFHDLRNGTDPAFSYRGAGGEVTINREMGKLAENPVRGLRFVLFFLGSPLARGTSASMLTLAGIFGTVLLGSLLGFLLTWALRWRRGENIGVALPWLLIGIYAVGTAGLAAVGRAWASQSGDNALSPRYVVHSSALIIAVIVLVAFELNRRRQRGPSFRPGVGKVAAALISGYLLWQAVGWNHGRLMMGVWESARLRAATSALFYNLQEEVDTDDWVPRNMGFVRRVNALGLLRPPLLTDDRLKNFKVETKPASSSTAAWTSLRKLEDGSFYAEGYARLPGRARVADGIFFTQRGTDLREHIVHVAHVSRLPLYLGKAIGRDLRFVHHQGDPLEQTDLSGFETEFELSHGASGSVVLSAWVFDYRAWSVQLIDRYFYDPKTGQIDGLSRHPPRNDMIRRQRGRGKRAGVPAAASPMPQAPPVPPVEAASESPEPVVPAPSDTRPGD